MKRLTLILLICTTLTSCFNDDGIAKKGFQVNEISEDEDGTKKVGLPIDSLILETRPRNVLLTKNASHRLTPIYKINYIKNKKHKNDSVAYTGSNDFHNNWGYYNGADPEENNWNRNFMPGFAAAYGYNFVNVSHYNTETKTQNLFFKKPVLIKTLYYPAYSKDTLNLQAVTRNFYMTSVYDQDTNKDGYINVKDLRHFYHFDIEGKDKTALTPENHSVTNSEYDPQNDVMYVFSRIDRNDNGQIEQNEPSAIYWIDLKDRKNNGIQYGTPYLNSENVE